MSVITNITPKLVNAKNRLCFCFILSPLNFLTMLWFSAPAIKLLIPKIINPLIAPYNILLSKLVFNGSVTKISIPSIMLRIVIIVRENFVFGSVVIYFDKPATLLILDIGLNTAPY